MKRNFGSLTLNLTQYLHEGFVGAVRIKEKTTDIQEDSKYVCRHTCELCVCVCVCVYRWFVLKCVHYIILHKSDDRLSGEWRISKYHKLNQSVLFRFWILKPLHRGLKNIESTHRMMCPARYPNLTPVEQNFSTLMLGATKVELTLFFV
jgi:hypothetical protein